VKPRPIVDFQSPDMTGTYGGREVDAEWINAVRSAAGDIRGIVVDLGSGGGLYSSVLARLGPKLVVSVDLSMSALAGSPASNGDPRCSPIVRVQSDVEALALTSGAIECIVCRAVIHHWPSLRPGFDETFRTLVRGGFVWVQDRTVEDVERKGSQSHLRGWFLELFPKLAEIERSRRYAADEVADALRCSSFSEVRVFTIFETRAIFSTPQDLTHDIVSRHGRSLLHALTDDEAKTLAQEVCSRIDHWPVTERDRWTVWTARRPT
jgi:SAM-dependent methyltransferase